MRSFRLDPGSVAEFFDSWPALLIGALLAALAVILGITHVWGQACAVLIVGLYGGYWLKGLAADRLREKYDGARCLWLLTAGMTTAVVGAATRMAFPQTQGATFDFAWLGGAFFSILTFVIMNRKNPNVVR